MEADTQAQIARRDGFGHERAYEGETNDWITLTSAGSHPLKGVEECGMRHPPPLDRLAN